jgi:P27 family predicted phage terminase small subunit
MGARGPAKRPAALRLAGGRSPGHDVAGWPVKTPPPFRRVAPAPPEWLGPYALEIWLSHVGQLERFGLIKAEDMGALASYCEAVEQFRDATLDIRERGLIIEEHAATKDGEIFVARVKANPAVQVQNAAAGRIRAFAQQFGFSPSAEANLSKAGGESSAPGAGDSASPFAFAG